MVMSIVRTALQGVVSPLQGRPRGAVIGQIAEPDPDPVVLVHGFLDYADAPWWRRMEKMLMSAGWPEDRVRGVTDPQMFGMSVGSPISSAGQIQAQLESTHDDYGQPVNIIAHSMGGLKARWVIEHGDGAEYVNDLVTIGTPHQGTYTAYGALLTPGGRDMLPESPFISNLNGGGLAPSVRYTSVWSSADSLVLPQSNGAIPKSIIAENTKNINCGWKEHVSMVRDPEVLKLYTDRLV
jgi:triacylglycerol lipase